MTDDPITIRAMCEMFDVTPRTLRFYEQKELLSPTRDGRRRLYGRRERGRMKLILRGKRFGFSLEQIRQLLNLYDPADAGTGQIRRSAEVARERLAELEAERAALEQVIDELREHLDWGEAMIAREQEPPLNAA